MGPHIWAFPLGLHRYSLQKMLSTSATAIVRQTFLPSHASHSYFPTDPPHGDHFRNDLTCIHISPIHKFLNVSYVQNVCRTTIYFYKKAWPTLALGVGATCQLAWLAAMGIDPC